jgi:ADP-ribosylation factor-like protein 5B
MAVPHSAEAIQSRYSLQVFMQVGSNVEQVKVENLTFEIWDLGGQAGLRPSWTTYFTATDAVILVVDCTDRGRLGIAKGELQGLLQNEQLAAACVLVLANKQDLKGAMSASELSEELELPSIMTHNWHVQSCCATKGEGLLDGMNWVAQNVRLKRKTLAAG